jgi:hypothetical protein
MDSQALKERWIDAALDRAGIDRRRWDPEAGVDTNRRTIEAVYNYYGRLFTENGFLLWAGMSNMIGAAFYAAFLDIGYFPDAARRLAARLLGRMSRQDSRVVAGELGFYEQLFLTMQKKIFEDQASMHEAYLHGGVAEIGRFYEAGIIDLATFGAWREIDRGRSEQAREPIENGSRMLLWREQRDIIGHFYDMMRRRHGLEGELFTYAMTLFGAPSIPGARSEAEVYPVVWRASLPARRVRVTTPAAEGNIAHFTTRWRLIERDTLPAYLKYVRDREDEARTEAQTPVAERIAKYRLVARLGVLTAAAFTRWRVSVRAGAHADAERGEAQEIRSGEPIVIDLETPTTAERLWMSSSASSLVWTGTRRAYVKADVRLPNQSVFDAEAETIAALRFDGAPHPNHIAVRLPPSDLDTTDRRLRDYAAQWSIDIDQVERWKSDAESLASSSDRTHGTHVLRPSPIGFVQLEFEVSHHVRERHFQISALFSW